MMRDAKGCFSRGRKLKGSVHSTLLLFQKNTSEKWKRNINKSLLVRIMHCYEAARPFLLQLEIFQPNTLFFQYRCKAYNCRIYESFAQYCVYSMYRIQTQSTVVHFLHKKQYKKIPYIPRFLLLPCVITTKQYSHVCSQNYFFPDHKWT